MSSLDAWSGLDCEKRGASYLGFVGEVWKVLLSLEYPGVRPRVSVALGFTVGPWKGGANCHTRARTTPVLCRQKVIPMDPCAVPTTVAFRG